MSEAEQQQPQPLPMYKPNNYIPQAEVGALQYQLEGIDTVERIEHIIKGEVEKIDTKNQQLTWIKSFVPMVNEKGMNMIRGYLTMYLGGTKTYALSDFSDDYISDEVIDIGRNIKNELMDNWIEYDVKDYASASFIINIVTSAVHAVLKKGMNANYLKFLRTTQNIQEVQHHQAFTQNAPQPQENSLFGAIFGKKNKRF